MNQCVKLKPSIRKDKGKETIAFLESLSRFHVIGKAYCLMSQRSLKSHKTHTWIIHDPKNDKFEVPSGKRNRPLPYA